MAYDIYGNYLKPGHCEVHPWVNEPYPCCQCMEEEWDEKRQMDEEYERYCKEQMRKEYIKHLEQSQHSEGGE